MAPRAVFGLIAMQKTWVLDSAERLWFYHHFFGWNRISPISSYTDTWKWIVCLRLFWNLYYFRCYMIRKGENQIWQKNTCKEEIFIRCWDGYLKLAYERKWKPVLNRYVGFQRTLKFCDSQISAVAVLWNHFQFWVLIYTWFQKFLKISHIFGTNKVYKRDKICRLFWAKYRNVEKSYLLKRGYNVYL